MESVLEWGVEVVRAVQAFLGPGMRVPMLAVSFVGSEIFAMAALPFLYWCVDRRKGARIGLVVLISAFANLFFKHLFMQPRPYDLDPAVGMAREPTPGLPSGHSQTSVTFWGAMLGVLPRAAGIAAVLMIPLAVGLSRVYLGVHFPTDVFAGWALGLVILGLFYGVGGRLEQVLHGFDVRMRVLVAAGAAFLMNWLLPADTSMAGAFLGAGVGFGFASKHARFSAEGTVREKALRYLLGIAGTAVLYIVPKILVGDSFPAQASLIRFVRYAIVGGWVSIGAPLAFIRLRLVELETLPESLGGLKNASGR